MIGDGGYDIAGVTNINIACNHNVGNNGFGFLYVDSGNSLSQPDNTHLECSQENFGVDGSGAMIQTGGINTVTSVLFLGVSSGTANVGSYNEPPILAP